MKNLFKNILNLIVLGVLAYFTLQGAHWSVNLFRLWTVVPFVLSLVLLMLTFAAAFLPKEKFEKLDTSVDKFVPKSWAKFIGLVFIAVAGGVFGFWYGLIWACYYVWLYAFMFITREKLKEAKA